MLSVSSAQLDAWIAGFLWPLVRILALVATAPLLGHRNVPVRVKIGLAVLTALVVSPALPDSARYSPASAIGLVVLFQQILIGVALGFTLRIVFAAIELGGEIIAAQMGLNFAGFFNPQSAQQGTPIGAWFGLLMMLVFLAMNGHLIMIQALVDSFAVAPIGVDGIGVGDWRRLALLGTDLFRIGVYAALPVIAAMLLSNLALGVLARIAPQLNLLAVGFSATILIGFAVLLLAMPAMGAYFQQSLERGLTMMVLR